MNLKLKNNTILIIPKNIKQKIILYLNSFDKMFDIKIYTIEEFRKRLLFDYDEKTIYYLINNYHYTFNIANKLIKNMYYILDEKSQNIKINNLIDLKNKLLEKKLLYKDEYFCKLLKSREANFFGFDYISKFDLKLLEIYNIKYNVIKKYDNNYEHRILKFANINEEIEYIVNDIIENNYDINHVFLANINQDNINTVRRIFKNYNINLNLSDKTVLYDTIDAKNFLNSFNINEVKSNEIKKNIIDILNKYYFINDKKEIKRILIDEFKNKSIPNIKYKNAVNEIDLKDNFINDEDYIYLINFNNEYIPINYKDEDYINDNEKDDYLEKTFEKNLINKKIWTNIIKNIKNLTISFSSQNFTKSLNPSSLILDNNYTIYDKEYIASNYSNKSNKYNLAIILDNYLKFGTENSEKSRLISTYPNINYLQYDNTYHKIDFNHNELYLSYSKMDDFYKCPFKYYCENILRLKKKENTFEEWLGSLCHYILSKMYNDNFDFDTEKNNFINDKKFNLTLENIVYEEKILNELKQAIIFIKKQYNDTLYKDIECEKNINLKIKNTTFTGIIDKIMKYNDNIVLIDYKTGAIDINLKLCNYGLNLQLPTYIYLIKSIYPKSNITGIYLQHIVKPLTNFEFGKKENDITESNLKLSGYTVGDENIISEFDPTYENSIYIKGLKIGPKGFYANSKVLTKNEFNNLEKLAIKKINECIDKINNADFKIEPKQNGENNVSCLYCDFKPICYKTNNDIVMITEDKDLNFLGGENIE